MRKIGVEEELLLVDEDSGAPRAAARPVLQYAERVETSVADSDRGSSAREPSEAPARPFGHLESELQQEQVEIDTHPHTDLAELEAELRRRRHGADEAARSQGARVAALATSPVPVSPRTTRDPRYQAMVEHFALTTTEQLACGLHVHVSIDSADEAVAVLDRIRVWLPVLLALSANSPYWQGADTGYASFRNQALQRWPSSGPTDIYGSVEGHRSLRAAQLATGVLLDDSMFYADARISSHYPTVEIRVADVCLDVADSVLVAALARGLVETAARAWRAGEEAAPVPTSLIRLATWRAARSAVQSSLLHPVDNVPRPAREIVGLLLEHVRPALRDGADEEWVESALAVFWNRGNGARSQRAAWERSKDGVAVVHDAVARTLA